MTELDGFLPQEVAAIVDEYGKAITLTKQGPGAYDPETATAAPSGAPRAVKAIVEPYRGQRLLAGLVEASDLKLTIAAHGQDEDPTSEDLAHIDGVAHTVVNVMVTYSGELKALYELQVRR